MKLNKIIIGLCILILSLSCVNADLITDNEAYYTLDDVYTDATENGYTATGSGTSFVTGKINNAVDFDATTDTLTIPAGMMTSWDEDSSYTIGFWFKTDSVTVRKDVIYPMNSGANEYTIYAGSRRLTNGDFQVLVQEAGIGEVYIATTPTGTIIIDTWYYIVISQNSTGLYLYINDVLEASDTTKTNTGSTAGNTQILFSRNHATYGWLGSLDEVSIWNRSISTTEITELYNSGSGLQYPYSTAPSINPVINFTNVSLNNVTSFNNTYINTSEANFYLEVNNVSTNDNINLSYNLNDNDLIVSDSLIAYYQGENNANDRLNYSNGVWTAGENYSNSINSSYGNALDFNGINAYITLNNNIQVSTTNSSISWWAKKDGNTMRSVLGDSTSNDDYILHDGINNKLILEFSSTLTTYSLDYTGITYSDWNNYLITMDNNNVTLYINNILQDSETVSTDVFNINRISNTYSAIASRRFFDGQIDEVRIYNKSLNTTEIQTLYNTSPYTNICSDCLNTDNLVTAQQTFNNPVKNISGIDYPLYGTTGTNQLLQYCIEQGYTKYKDNINNANNPASVDYAQYSGVLWYITTASNRASVQYLTCYNTTNYLELDLTDDNYNITFFAQNNETFNQTKYLFTIDTTNPNLNVSLSNEYNYYDNFNFSNYITYNDTNIDTCIVTISGETQTTCNETSYTFTTNGNKTINITATDLAGHTNSSLNNIMLIDPIQIIYFNNSNATQITNFTLNDINYTNYANISLYSLGLGSHNLTFEKQGYERGNITLTLNTTSNINTTYVIPFAKLIFTFYDITDSSYIESMNDTTIQVIGDSYSKVTVTQNRNLTIIDSDITLGDYNVIVSNINYDTVNTLFTYDNQELLNINIYMTPVDTPSEDVADLIIEVQDLDGNVQGSILTFQYIWDSSTLQDILINQKTTDYRGQTSYKVFLDTRLYTFCAEYDSVMYCNEPVTININTDKVIVAIDTSVLGTTDQNRLYEVGFDYSLNNATTGNQSLISFNWNNPSQNVDEYCLKVYKLIEGIETLLSPSGSQCSQSHSSGLDLLIIIDNETVYIAKAIIIQDGTQRILEVIKINTNYELLGFLETYGLHKLICLVLIFIAVGIGLHPKVHNVTITHISIPVSYLVISILFPTILTLDIFIIILLINLGTIRLFTKRDDVATQTNTNTLISILIIYVLMIFTTVALLEDFEDRNMLDDYGDNLLYYLTESKNIYGDVNDFVGLTNEELNLTKEGSSPAGEDKTDNTLTIFIKSLGWVDTFFNIISKIFSIPETIYVMLGFTTTFLTGLFFYINWILNLTVMTVFYKSLFK